MSGIYLYGIFHCKSLGALWLVAPADFNCTLRCVYSALRAGDIRGHFLPQGKERVVKVGTPTRTAPKRPCTAVGNVLPAYRWLLMGTSLQRLLFLHNPLGYEKKHVGFQLPCVRDVSAWSGVGITV